MAIQETALSKLASDILQAALSRPERLISGSYEWQAFVESLNEKVEALVSSSAVQTLKEGGQQEVSVPTTLKSSLEKWEWSG